MVGGPAHGPRVDVVHLAAGARARALVTPAILKEVLDESGVHQVYTIYVGGTFGFAPGLLKFAF